MFFLSLLQGGCHVLLTFFASIVILVLSLAAIGKSIGIRRLYISILFKVFEWASSTIAEEERKEGREVDWEFTESDDDKQEHLQNMDDRKLSMHVIKKEATGRIMRQISTAEPQQSKMVTMVRDSYEFMKAGVEAIIEDDVTCRFSAAQLVGWNLLSRTSLGYEFINYKLTLVWLLGTLFRYCFLFPLRFVIFLVAMVYLMLCNTLIRFISDGELKRKLNWYISITHNRILARAVSVVVNYHRREDKTKPGGICVANHTSLLDVTVLSMDNCYALVGQIHGGLLGVVQRAQGPNNIWFERADANDRAAVSKRLREHVQTANLLPILLFPEGTCINNTSVMMFKKGSFEVGGVIYPVAIKYDPRLANAFWNSSEQSYFRYMLMLMTSWATLADVHYLPAMTRNEGESGAEFAGRVKHAIAEAGGLVELDWDGGLKRSKVKPEQVAKQKQRYSKRVIGSGNGDELVE